MSLEPRERLEHPVRGAALLTIIAGVVYLFGFSHMFGAHLSAEVTWRAYENRRLCADGADLPDGACEAPTMDATIAGSDDDIEGRAIAIPRERLIRMLGGGVLALDTSYETAVFVDEFGFIRASFPLHRPIDDDRPGCLAAHIFRGVELRSAIDTKDLPPLVRVIRFFIPTCTKSFSDLYAAEHPFLHY